MIPVSLLLLSTSILEVPDAGHKPCPVIASINPTFSELYQTISDTSFYLGAGTTLGAISILGRIGWGLSLITPWSSTFGNECLLLSQVCGNIAQRFYSQIGRKGHQIPFSHQSWHDNQTQLSQVPFSSTEDLELIDFLKNRWLAKATGFYPSMIDWIFPCFGVQIQVHPETRSSYARDPSEKLSYTYINRTDHWKKTLPHPEYFPLLLTRPCDIREYLPYHLQVPENENPLSTLQRIEGDSFVLLDLTEHFSTQDKKQWFHAWKKYQAELLKACETKKIDPNRIVCFQRVMQKTIGGIRLLPLSEISPHSADKHERFLLVWISKAGLTANRIELDRYPSSPLLPKKDSAALNRLSKDEFLDYLKSWNPQQDLMISGTLKVLKGLLSSISDIEDATRTAIAEFSFFNIKHQLDLLNDKMSFFDTACHLEQIHANFSTLLEIFSPYTFEDFSPIYQNLLSSIPQTLKPLTSAGIHASGMTSLTGVFKAVEKMHGGRPIHILLGENTYFECITTASRIAKARFVEEATEQEWKDVDLILAQFNPVLKRIDFEVTEYRVERVAESLRKALALREGRPLTLALDCTLDYIDSPRLHALLTEFSKEIVEGKLNIAFYRSGLKYDLFGMDNYSGAPFYIINNGDTQWAPFANITTDPALQSDRLSLNWFCLAYQHASLELEHYRKQTFENTRALLNKLPTRLFNETAQYRVIPVEQDADPSFLDIKISGPLHQLRGAVLVGGTLLLKCMEGAQPIFYRPSIGFYHANHTMLFGKEYTTIRLTLGLDSAQVDVLADFFKTIDALNGAPVEPLANYIFY